MSQLVSIIIPTYYRNNLLRKCIHSAVRQKHTPLEIIVVDDSGEEHAKPIIDQYTESNITYIAHPQNRGAQAARNTGLEASTGNYIQFLDDDDILHPRKITQQVETFQNSNGIDVVYCGITYADGRTHFPVPDAKGDVLEYALKFHGSPMSNSALLIRRKAILDVCPLYEGSPGADDLRLNIKLAKDHLYDFVNAPLVRASVHSGSRGSSWGAIEGRKRILHDFENLYATRKKEKKIALAKTYRLEAKKSLEELRWSRRAIKKAIRAARIDPRNKFSHYAFILAALLGYPGMRLAYKIR